MKGRKSTWLKNRGYLHITPQINVHIKRDEIFGKLHNEKYIAKHAFYPLLHSVIKVRRYKIVDNKIRKRAHSFNGKQTSKERPLHYATHIDALIFGYYGEILQKKYELLLSKNRNLSECITAYRKIEDPDNLGKFKSTINFANEVFQEIKGRSEYECSVLKFDIEKFFSSINHETLKRSWIDLLELDTLPNDHYNVFKASTKFSYILRDDLRLRSDHKERRSRFDEKRLAEIRKKGIVSFFESDKEFREKIKNGEIKVHKYPFRDKENNPMGIPQGLPISALLANLYLLSFDKKVLDEVVGRFDAFYRRYSDDIIIISKPKDSIQIENYIINLIRESKVEISKEKTESFLFKRTLTKSGEEQLCSYKLCDDSVIERFPFTYLGFEFNGTQTLIKSANLAKFYRRMIVAVKRKAKRAITVFNNNPNQPICVFRNQLVRLYSNISLDRVKIINRRKQLVKTKYGYFVYKSESFEKKNRSNYFSYVKRSGLIMNEPAIEHQLKKHKKIFNQAIRYHLNRSKLKKK
jgi:hypothetical protein